MCVRNINKTASEAYELTGRGYIPINRYRGNIGQYQIKKWGYFEHSSEAITECPTLWITYLHILNPYLLN